MADQFGTSTLPSSEAQLTRQAFMTSVFGWMFVGLALTAGIAAYVAASGDMLAWFEDHPLAYFGIFAGLTAFDMQKLKGIGESGIEGESAQKASILGALSLYLDFINMFLFL